MVESSLRLACPLFFLLPVSAETDATWSMFMVMAMCERDMRIPSWEDLWEGWD